MSLHTGWKTSLLLALLLVPRLAPAQGTPVERPREQRKELTPASFEARKTKAATVYLVSSRPLAWDIASKRGAQGGMEFSFLVVPHARNAPAPAVQPPQDVLVSGQSYAARTSQRLKRSFTPETTTQDPAKVQRQGKPLQQIFGLAPGQGTVVSTSLFGSALPVRSDLAVSMTVGGEVVEFKLGAR